MSARTSLIIPFLLCSAIIGRAQQPSAPPDFSDGFKQLAALGMPALDAKAIWAVVAEAGTNYELRELAKSVKGNAWLLAAAEGKPRAIALGGIEVIELKSPKQHPTGPDLTKDVEAIIAGLKKLAAKMAGDDRVVRFNGSNFASFLLFAAQLYQTGHPALANQLALAVFEVYPSREAAVDAAVDLLAEHSYQEATRAFFTSYDWAAYHTALAVLSKRFPRGWSSHDAVAIFLPQLAKQAAGAKAPAPTLPGIPIDPRAAAIIAELTDQPPVEPNHANPNDRNARALSASMRYRMRIGEGYDGDPSGPTSLWLISEPPAGADAEAKASPLARLATLKMAAIPALAALTADPFLTRLPNSRSYSGYSRYLSPNESSDDPSLRIYASLNRPATRGEIAIQLLAATLPEADDERTEADPDAIRETALTFWKEHKNATREELAAIFLHDGSKRQSHTAASILAASADPKAHQAFEAHVLAADPAIASFQVVQTYLRARKAAARPFFDAYVKLVLSQGGTGDNDSSDDLARAVKQAGGAEKFLNQLKVLVGGQSPRALAVQIAKGKPADAEAAIESILSLLEDATPTRQLHALLEGANAATDASIRARFLSATWSIRWRAEQADEGPGDEEPWEDTAPPERKVSEPEAKVWQKLIADTRELPKDTDFLRESGLGDDTPTIAAAAAYAFENSISPWTARTLQQASAILDKPFPAILMERATARLAGKPVPPLPDASRVSRKRLTEIVATAGGKSAPDIHPYLSSLTPDERAAWRQWIDNPEDLPIPPSVKQLRAVITDRGKASPVSVIKDTKGVGNLDVGFRVTPDSLIAHIESLAPEMDRHSRSIIFAHSAPLVQGLEIVAAIAPLPPQNDAPPAAPDDAENNGGEVRWESIFSSAIKALDANPDAPAVAFVCLYLGDSARNAVWLIQNGKATLQEPEEVRSAFRALLEHLSDPDINVGMDAEPGERTSFGFEIEILSRADAGKFKAASKEKPAPFEKSLPPTEDDEPPLPALPPLPP